MLSHISARSPELLKKLSGAKQRLDSEQNIALVGGGSLGSKIGMHLVRNGNGPFMCIDNELFLPHNNARHALASIWANMKADMLAAAFFAVSGQLPATGINAISADYSNSRLIIDSTASFAIRSFLMGCSTRPPVISAGLYDRGKYGILFTENANRTTQISDLWAHLYLMSIHNTEIRQMLFSSQQEQITIGQSCSSNTLVMSDAQISLFASTFSLRIQRFLEDGLPASGELLMVKTGQFGSLSVDRFEIPESLAVSPLRPKNWQVRLSSSVEKRMREASDRKAPNETGGVLLGSVFLNAKVVVVTDIIDPPPDSVETPTLFVLGTEGLEAQIKSVERKTNGKVTYLGTWHSHPFGGGASSTDKATASRLLFVRNYEPTVCLIWTAKDVFEV
jgi:integrative and conjugative element protein (TIGR02256 family)